MATFVSGSEGGGGGAAGEKGQGGGVHHCRQDCKLHKYFRDSERIFPAFVEALEMPNRIYHGNESFHDTVDIFSNFSVVVGYYG